MNTRRTKIEAVLAVIVTATLALTAGVAGYRQGRKAVAVPGYRHGLAAVSVPVSAAPRVQTESYHVPVQILTFCVPWHRQILSSLAGVRVHSLGASTLSNFKAEMAATAQAG